MSDGAGFELAMPFVAVESNGGPYPDAAFGAGFMMGRVDACLEVSASVGRTQYPPADGHILVVRNLLPQLDLIAMRHGFVTEHCVSIGGEDDADDWVAVRFRRGGPTTL